LLFYFIVTLLCLWRQQNAMACMAARLFGGAVGVEECVAEQAF
jgi:hypothetical protein